MEAQTGRWNAACEPWGHSSKSQTHASIEYENIINWPLFDSAAKIVKHFKARDLFDLK